MHPSPSLLSAGVASFVLALSAACTPSPAARLADAGTPPTADTYLGTDRDALFQSLVAQLQASERSPAGGLAMLGTTWDAQLARTQQRFRAAQTPQEAFYALLSLKVSFHDPHSELLHEPGSPLRNPPNAMMPTGGPVVLPASVRLEYDTTGAPQYLIDAPGVAPGTVVTGADGQDLATLRNTVLEWYPLHSQPGLDEAVTQWLQYRDPMQEPAPAAGAQTTLTVTPPGGSPTTLTLTWQALPPQPGPSDGPSSTATSNAAQTGASSPTSPTTAAAATATVGSTATSTAVDPVAPTPPTGTAQCQAPQGGDVDADYAGLTAEWAGIYVCVYPGSDAATKYVRYFSFNYSDDTTLHADQSALMTYLRGAGVTRVLFDVRENGGGTFDPAFFANFTASTYRIPVRHLVYLPVFRTDPTQLANVDGDFGPIANPAALFQADMTAHPTATESAGLAFFCKTTACGPDEAAYAPAAGAPAPLAAAVLTGPDCVSSCDDFVSIMKDNGIAQLLGEPSAGGDAPFKLPVTARLADGEAFDWRLTVGISDRPDARGTELEGNPPAVDLPLLRTAATRGHFLAAALAALGWSAR